MLESRDRGSDVGAAAVDQIYKLWQIDEAWSLRENRGFTWWGGDFRQRISVDLGREDKGVFVYQLSAETDVLMGVDAQAPAVVERLALLNRFASSYAIVLGQPAGRVSLRSSVILHEQNADWIVNFFSVLAIIQPVDAQVRAGLFVELLGGKRDVSGHPHSGVRPKYDDMLNVIRAVYRPIGEKPSRWLESGEFERFLSIAPEYGLFSTGGATGLSAELAFGNETALITAAANQPHPQLGSGLLLLLKLPLTLAKQAAQRLAVELNAAETNTFAGSHLLGGWCTEEHSPDKQLLVFASFVPNVAYRPGLVAILIMTLAHKSRWARGQIAIDSGLPFPFQNDTGGGRGAARK